MAGNVGAIVGGFVAGVVTISLITYVVWRFFIKAERRAYTYDTFYNDQAERRTPARPDQPFLLQSVIP